MSSLLLFSVLLIANEEKERRVATCGRRYSLKTLNPLPNVLESSLLPPLSYSSYSSHDKCSTGCGILSHLVSL